MKKLLSLMIAAALLSGICLVPAGALTETWTDDGNYSIDWYAEGQSEFFLHTPQELAGLAVLTGQGKQFTNQTIYLKSDLDLSGKTWVPIGSKEDYPFSGTLDGNLYAVNGLNAPLFSFVGAQGTVRNLQAQGTIKSETDAAGLVLTNEGTVLNCVVNVAVEGHMAGGIVCLNSGMILNCMQTAPVTADSSSGATVGGIVADNRKTGKVCGCAVDAAVDRKTDNCAGAVIGSSYGSYTYCFYAKHDAINQNLFAVGSYYDAASDRWITPTEETASAASYNAKYESTYQADTLPLYSLLDNWASHYGQDNGAALWQADANGRPKIVTESWRLERYCDLSFYDPSKYLFSISTSQQFAGFARLVAQGVDFTGKTVQLVNGIDVSREDWIPVGSKNTEFNGTFNGQMYPVFGGVSASGGLFQCIGQTGVVKNAEFFGTLINSQIGGIALVNKGLIVNCSVFGSQHGKEIGGLAHTNYGRINNGSTCVVIELCDDQEMAGGMGGGLVCVNYGSMDNNHACGTVTGENAVALGFITARSSGILTNNWFLQPENSTVFSVGQVPDTTDPGIFRNCTAHAAGTGSFDENGNTADGTLLDALNRVVQADPTWNYYLWNSAPYTLRDFVLFHIGDVNLDNQRNTTDALLTLRYAVGKNVPGIRSISMADVNFDSAITTTDALVILRWAVGKYE